MKKQPVALVTGAGLGIGRQVVLELAGAGYDVAGVDLVFEPENRGSGLFEVKRRAEDRGVRFLPLQGDISELKDHKKILEESLSQFGRIDVLVNNAGVAPEKRMDILETTAQSYDRVLSVNARGAFFLTQRVAHLMIDQVRKDPDSQSCIIFISSISADVSSPSRAEYCISKAALSQAARVFADRLTEYGINVYEIRPGIIRTGMTALVREKYDRLIAEGLVPQKRWGLPEDVAKAVVALAQGAFAYSTGLVVEVSGGMNIRRL
ncbi:MAG: 3-ketoacyl-ACP reductase [Candidatus Aminicenantes bacterium]|jgi:NAD(P)-dependent dehydrogenase (short-subunit alcohol dehydrogenase family)